MKTLLKTTIPFALFILLAVLLYRGLQLDPHHLPSALINMPAPTFELTTLDEKQQFKRSDLLGHVSVVNVWATWCLPCRKEHPLLIDLKRDAQVIMYGIDYKDNYLKAKSWLTEYGNPFDKVGFDLEGNVSIDWGVYGTPETFVVDKRGVVRYRHVGVLTNSIIRNKLLPLIEKLKA